jgi:hypothetical protein
MYYKVTQSNLMSARCGMVQYVLGEWVSPAFGRLMVFDSLDSAKKFAQIWEKIFECECEDVQPQPTLALRSDQLAEFWLGRVEAEVMEAPLGTLSCTKVRLVRQVVRWSRDLERWVAVGSING